MPLPAVRCNNPMASTAPGTHFNGSDSKKSATVSRMIFACFEWAHCAALAQGFNLTASAYRITQPNHENEQRQMPSLLAAQTFRQGPIENNQFSSLIVIKQIACMRIGVEQRVFLRCEKRNGNQGFDQLLSHLSTASCGHPSNRLGHLSRHAPHSSP